MNKLLLAKKVLEEGIKSESFVDIIEVGTEGRISISRERLSEVMKGIINELEERIDRINSLLEETKNEFGTNNFTGIVLLEFDNGMPSRILLSQPLTLGDGS